MNEFMTPKEFANKFNISDETVRRWCRQGKLGIQVGKQWRISIDEYRRFIGDNEDAEQEHAGAKTL